MATGLLGSERRAPGAGRRRIRWPGGHSCCPRWCPAAGFGGECICGGSRDQRSGARARCRSSVRYGRVDLPIDRRGRRVRRCDCRAAGPRHRQAGSGRGGECPGARDPAARHHLSCADTAGVPAGRAARRGRAGSYRHRRHRRGRAGRTGGPCRAHRRRDARQREDHDRGRSRRPRAGECQARRSGGGLALATIFTGSSKAGGSCSVASTCRAIAARSAIPMRM